MNKQDSDSNSSLFFSPIRDVTPIKPKIPLDEYIFAALGNRNFDSKHLALYKSNSSKNSNSTADSAKSRIEILESFKHGSKSLGGILGDFEKEIIQFKEKGGFGSFLKIFYHDQFTLIEDLKIIFEVSKYGKCDFSRRFLAEIIDNVFCNRTIESIRDRYRSYLVHLTEENLEFIHSRIKSQGIAGYMNFRMEGEKRVFDGISKQPGSREYQAAKRALRVAKTFKRYRKIKLSFCACKLRHARETLEVTQTENLNISSKTKGCEIEDLSKMDLKLMIHVTENKYQSQYSEIPLGNMRFVAFEKMNFEDGEHFKPDSNQLEILRKYERHYSLDLERILETGAHYKKFSDLINFLESELEGSVNPTIWSGAKQLSPNSKITKLKNKAIDYLKKGNRGRNIKLITNTLNKT